VALGHNYAPVVGEVWGSTGVCMVQRPCALTWALQHVVGVLPAPVAWQACQGCVAVIQAVIKMACGMLWMGGWAVALCDSLLFPFVQHGPVLSCVSAHLNAGLSSLCLALQHREAAMACVLPHLDTCVAVLCCGTVQGTVLPLWPHKQCTW
jgi:hypothetical protein